MISIILPAHNEEKNIENTIKDISGKFQGNELIVVSDGSDETEKKVNQADIRGVKLLLLTFDERIGKWGAIRKGIEASKGDYIGFLDADLSVSAGEAMRLVSLLREDKYDAVISSRYIPGSVITRKQSFSRIVYSRIFNRLVRILFGLNFSDTQCGCKVFRADFAKRVSSMMKCSGFEGDAEFLWLSKKLGGRIREEPVTWSDSGSSSFRTHKALSMFFNLLKTRFWSHRKSF